MHASVYDWVAEQVARYRLAGRPTLECGSLDVNGSVRDLFTGRYTGIDLQAGPGVDIVCSAARMPFDHASFDVVVTTEMLEHDPTFWLSIREIRRVLRPGGLLLLTTRGIGFPLHEFPSDYWRFTLAAVRQLLVYGDFRPLELADDPEQSGVFALGRRR